MWKTCEGQNDRIGKINRFEKWLDQFELTKLLKSKEWVKNPVLSLRPIEQSAKKEAIRDAFAPKLRARMRAKRQVVVDILAVS